MKGNGIYLDIPQEICFKKNGICQGVANGKR
jgi:hypothetical protein